ncbi:transmembrane protein 45B-like [Ruditapes philippinarum]|uniref:transmembrane protein 45B-like n=1 Tax=Ruditapes philippinarum TaxID=129788 RepID=UPI00295C31ED|nr:transmembrane protein 45B-like [Ruditapes philippinarum]
MGSFAGHIDEGIAFIILALWWMVNIFRESLKTNHQPELYHSQISYTIRIKGKVVPLEIFLKILFPLGGFAAEIIDAKTFVNEDGNFSNLSDLQHTTIYMLFVIHGITDLLAHYRLPQIKNANYFTMIVSFLWYGTAFYFHSEPGMGKPPLENMIHRLPIPFTLLTSCAVLIEMNQRNAVLPQLLRCFCVLTLGTWFTYSSFVLFLPYPFPGSHHNPAWDQDDERNVHFIVAAFGIHLIVNLTFMMTSYIVMVVYRKLFVNSRDLTDENSMCKYKILDNNVDDLDYDDSVYKDDAV